MAYDMKKIEDVFSGHIPGLLRNARKILNSDADAEDVVQEVMLSLVEAPGALLSVERIGAWLYTLLKRRCVDLVRRRKRRSKREFERGLEELIELGDPTGRLEDEELSREIADAINILPAELKDVFIKNSLQEKTYLEISRETGTPMGTLMARKKKAVRKIRERLQKRDIVI